MTLRSLPLALLVLALRVWQGTPATAQTTAQIDAVFAHWQGTASPGCTVAVSQNGQIQHTLAYGMADLEHDVVNTPETVLEPGSVSKQFTAAAAILLAQDGLISLDDDIRTHFPELPDYGETVTIRHLLNHNSGLRDWGAVASIGGWPRTTRMHTHVQALDITTRQLSLNYSPGTFYSYTNTGYNLLAMLVERISGISFAEFSRTRLFEPLGMSKTEWRDDFTRVVKDRAIAYRPNGTGGYAMQMPFENVHGNGGLLTTVGDLLAFTHALESDELGIKEEMHRQGVLNDGRVIAYASGLFVDEYRGVRQVGHSGATAGYRGYLSRYPDHGLAVAVMCNSASGNAGRLAHDVVDLYLADALEDAPSVPSPSVRIPRDRMQMLTGRFRNTRNHSMALLEPTTDGVRGPWGRFSSRTGTLFDGPGGRILEYADDDAFRLIGADGDSLLFERVLSWEPDIEALKSLEGGYHSAEAEVTYYLTLDATGLKIADRYGAASLMTPLYEDAFRSRLGIMRVVRDSRGRTTGLRLTQSRVWDLHFERVD
ncbi:MAG: CubicO group peptidase (beta-lactamase class C family) [Rhodothermales bacterium]|jgi:CubicO group peptidase (beta-lactamase class C family)